MVDPSIEELMDKKVNPNIASKFELVTMVAKRARQLNDGADPMVVTDKVKPVSIALLEIKAGMITPIKKPF